MKHLLGVFALSATLLWAATPAHAISISVDVPYANKTIIHSSGGDSTFNASSTGGYILGIGTPWWVGIAHEEYRSTLPNVPAGGNGLVVDLKMDTTINDVFLDLPTPLISVVVGYGVGSIEETNIQAKWNASQYFLRLGLNLGRFDLHVGLHKGTGIGVQTNNSQPPDLDFETMTAGARLRF